MGDIFKRGNFDYVKTTNPTVNVNPGFVGATWLNLTTGEVFVCLDNTPGENDWAGQKHTRIGPVVLPIIDGFYVDDFTGEDGAAPKLVWDSDGVVDIRSNALDFNYGGASTVDTFIPSRFKLSGDFDVQVDFNIVEVQTPNTSIHYVGVDLLFDSGDWIKQHQIRSATGSTQEQWESSIVSWGGYTDGLLSGKLRITRSSGTVKIFFWVAGAWKADNSLQGKTLLTSEVTDAQVVLYFKQQAGSLWHATLDNFKITYCDRIKWGVA